MDDAVVSGGLSRLSLTPLPLLALSDIFALGVHRIVCGSATDPATVRRLMQDDPAARLVLTDEPYNVKISGHVTGGGHREFAMASGEMTDAEFLAFNQAWMAAVLPYLCDGGIFGTFIDWRGLPTVDLAARKVGLVPLNLIVWAKTNAGMGSLYRSTTRVVAATVQEWLRPSRQQRGTGETRPLAVECLDLSWRLLARLQRPPRP